MKLHLAQVLQEKRLLPMFRGGQINETLFSRNMCGTDNSTVVCSTKKKRRVDIVLCGGARHQEWPCPSDWRGGGAICASSSLFTTPDKIDTLKSCIKTAWTSLLIAERSLLCQGRARISTGIAIRKNMQLLSIGTT